MAMSAVSFSDVSLMAIVPERECRMPTLIGPLSSVAGAAAATGAAGAALAGAAAAGVGAGGASPLLQAKNAPARPLKIGRHTSELQSRRDLVCRLLLEKK